MSTFNTQAPATNPASFRGSVCDVPRDGKKMLLKVVSQQVSQFVTVVTNFPAGWKKQADNFARMGHSFQHHFPHPNY
jgi:hypothetical protein